MADIVQYQAEFLAVQLNEEPEVSAVAQMFRNICYNNRDGLSAGIICAGWDKAKGGQVYSIPLGGMCLRQPFSIGGSGSTYLYGHCDASFRPNMTKEECLNFVAGGLLPQAASLLFFLWFLSVVVFLRSLCL